MLEGAPLARDMICKGAWVLGTACGKCSRCLETAPAEIARLRTKLEDAEVDASMYARAWQRELGSWMGPKRHHIDACVIGTQNLVAAERRQRPWVDALKRWRQDATTARTLGVPEPSLLSYLPTTEQPA
jgi:hypothetical protein